MSVSFNLKRAKSLIDDVAELTEEVVQLQALALEEKSFVSAFKKA